MSTTAHETRTVRAPRGTEISCRGWQQEAALRMLMNNLDPEVAENPDQLVVYGGRGRAARSWEAFDAIVRSLRALGDDETLLVQSGKPVGVFRTHEWSPRVLIANSNLVPDWATWEEFRRLEDLGLTMYVPNLMSLEKANELRQTDPDEYVRRARAACAAHCAAMVGFLDDGAEVFDYGNSLRAEAQLGGFERAFAYPGFVAAYIRPLFCEGKGPFRWVALSGEEADIEATDRAVLEEIPGDPALERWIRLAGERIAYQGLPARICWAGYGERHRLGLRFNDMVRSGELRAPIVIGRDHLDSGSVASPYRETEQMIDGSDAIADWPLLNALVNTAAGASWVSIHHGGGGGIGRSIHAGMVCVADGTDLAAEKLELVLTNDPVMGIFRHVDAGYEAAEQVAAERDVRIPMPEACPVLVEGVGELVTNDPSHGPAL